MSLNIMMVFILRWNYTELGSFSNGGVQEAAGFKLDFISGIEQDAWLKKNKIK